MRDKIGNKKKRMNTRLKNILMITILIASFILLINSAYAASSASRELPDYYISGNAISVSISVVIDSDIVVYAIEETPPSGWVISNINEEGEFANGKIRWIFDGNDSRTLTYTATPPAEESGTKTFSGVMAFYSTQLSIGGESSILQPTGEDNGGGDNGGGGGGGGGGGSGSYIPKNTSNQTQTEANLTGNQTDNNGISDIVNNYNDATVNAANKFGIVYYVVLVVLMIGIIVVIVLLVRRLRRKE